MEKEIIEIKKRLEKLEKVIFSGGKTALKEIDTGTPDLDFSLNSRAFVKKYSSGFNGKEFFVLILAYLAKGNETVVVSLKQIRTTWEDCSGIIGTPYASMFLTRAKENGWTDPSTRGSYVLGKYWRDIFKEHEQNS